MKIRSIDAYQVYDSRGNPTVEAEIQLEDGMHGRGTVHRPDSLRHWNFATGTRAASAENQSTRQLPISSRKSHRPLLAGMCWTRRV